MGEDAADDHAHRAADGCAGGECGKGDGAGAGGREGVGEDAELRAGLDVKEYQRADGTGRTEAGTTAAPPMPWKARRTSIVISSVRGH